MGLDISVNFDNQDDLYKLEEYDELEENSNLSRTFCNFLCRRNVVEDCQPELDQLGRITGIDINFLYEMEEYSEDWEIDEMLEFEEDENERIRRKNEILKQNQKISNNIDRVKSNLTELIKNLNEIPDLNTKLEQTSYDTLGIDKYFSEFKENLGDGYIGNNLGQDLRNLLRVIEFASINGSNTAYFNYG